MTQEHPITPPPELTQEWSCDCPLTDPFSREFYVATQAARWGADQELEACCVWLRGNDPYEHDYHQMLRAVRRPKPPSLRDKALAALQVFGPSGDLTPDEIDALRRALESLPD